MNMLLSENNDANAVIALVWPHRAAASISVTHIFKAHIVMLLTGDAGMAKS